jgi:hypothetical protein
MGSASGAAAPKTASGAKMASKIVESFMTERLLVLGKDRISFSM